MKERWMSGLYHGNRPGSEENLLMQEEGKVVRARPLRRCTRRSEWRAWTS